jgi:hypothetical protein
MGDPVISGSRLNLLSLANRRFQFLEYCHDSLSISHLSLYGFASFTVKLYQISFPNGSTYAFFATTLLGIMKNSAGTPPSLMLTKT